MKKLFLVYGSVICLVFAYATYTGWTVMDSVRAGRWSPHGHSAYHK